MGIYAAMVTIRDHSVKLVRKPRVVVDSFRPGCNLAASASVRLAFSFQALSSQSSVPRYLSIFISVNNYAEVNDLQAKKTLQTRLLSMPPR